MTYLYTLAADVIEQNSKKIYAMILFNKKKTDLGRFYNKGVPKRKVLGW
jgi:hypothetical protein